MSQIIRFHDLQGLETARTVGNDDPRIGDIYRGILILHDAIGRVDEDIYQDEGQAACQSNVIHQF
jgi:hypothetical protein